MSPQPILRDRSFLLNPSKCFQTSYNFQCPKTQCCYGFRQDCPFCPHSRNSMLFSPLITTKKYHMALRTIFLYCSCSSRNI